MPDSRDAPTGLHDGLIERIAAGDRDAFASLYRQCRGDVYRLAVHMCGSSAVAEDVVQDVFVAVIQDAARYGTGRSGVVPWLLGIARNHVLRWRHRRPVLPLPGEETDEGRRLAAATDPVGELTGRRQAAELRRALLALPARDREVIVLCDLQELTYESAAIALGCAIGTVRSRLHRARARLAREISGTGRSVALPVPASKLM